MGASPRLDFVGEGGLEPPRPEGHWHLKPARLPFRHSPERPRNIITPRPPPPNPWKSIPTTPPRPPQTHGSRTPPPLLTWRDPILRDLLVTLSRDRPITCL